MNTTFEELNQLFRLKSADYKQIKKGLINKITVVNDNDVLLKDEELKSLLTDFRTGGSYDMDEVCELYKISKNILLQLVRNNIISSFKLTSAQGSKILFLKSDLDRENNLLLVYSKKKDIAKLSLFAGKLIEILVEEWGMDKDELEIFRKYYFSSMSLEEIGKEYTLSGEAVRRRIYKNNIKLVTIFSSAIKDRSDKYWDKKNYDALEKKYNHLKNFIEGLEFMKKELNVPAVPAEPMPVNYSIRFIDLDNINVRLVNCLKAADVETIGDLMSLTKIDLLKYRNFGKKSLKELEDILAKFGISWNGEHPQANSEEKKN